MRKRMLAGFALSTLLTAAACDSSTAPVAPNVPPGSFCDRVSKLPFDGPHVQLDIVCRPARVAPDDSIVILRPVRG